MFKKAVRNILKVARRAIDKIDEFIATSINAEEKQEAHESIDNTDKSENIQTIDVEKIPNVINDQRVRENSPVSTQELPRVLITPYKSSSKNINIEPELDAQSTIQEKYLVALDKTDCKELDANISDVEGIDSFEVNNISDNFNVPYSVDANYYSAINLSNDTFEANIKKNIIDNDINKLDLDISFDEHILDDNLFDITDVQSLYELQDDSNPIDRDINELLEQDFDLVATDEKLDITSQTSEEIVEIAEVDVVANKSKQIDTDAPVNKSSNGLFIPDSHSDEQDLEDTNNHLLSILDIQRIKSPQLLVDLLRKLGYSVIDPSPICIEDYGLESSLQQLYLLADYKDNKSVSLQIFLFVLKSSQFLMADKVSVTRKLDSISNQLCRGAAKYLTFGTIDFNQLYVAHPSRKLDSNSDLKAYIDSILIDIKNPTFQSRNFLEKLCFVENVKKLVDKSGKSIQDYKEISAGQRDSKTRAFREDSFRLYLEAIGRIRLLRADEEIELARKIADLLELESKRKELAKEIDCHPYDVRESDWAIKMGLPLGEFRKRLHSGRRAKEKLVISNLRLVVSIAKNYTYRGLELDDLVQEGSLGLIRAAEKFDHTKGYKFSTYSTWWIRQAITRAIADQSRTIRLPVHLYDTISKIKKTMITLSQEIKRKPTYQEIANRMEIDIDKLRFIAMSAQLIISLETPIGKEENSRLGDFIEYEGDSPDEMVTKKLLLENIETLFEALKTDRERDVLRLRYGLKDGRTMTLEEIGQIFNLTRERIRQIEAKALNKLREPKYSDIKEYIY